MKRKAILLVGAMALTLVVFGGVALAATLYCASNIACNGTSEDDDIHGTLSADTIKALEGSDFVDAYGGNDTVYGGPGNDNKTFSDTDITAKGLVGGEESDTVYGEGGADYIDLVTFDTTDSVDTASGGGATTPSMHSTETKTESTAARAPATTSITTRG